MVALAILLNHSMGDLNHVYVIDDAIYLTTKQEFVRNISRTTRNQHRDNTKKSTQRHMAVGVDVAGPRGQAPVRLPDLANVNRPGA